MPFHTEKHKPTKLADILLKVDDNEDGEVYITGTMENNIRDLVVFMADSDAKGKPVNVLRLCASELKELGIVVRKD